jgi:hypothetical protein
MQSISIARYQQHRLYKAGTTHQHYTKAQNSDRFELPGDSVLSWKVPNILGIIR